MKNTKIPQAESNMVRSLLSVAIAMVSNDKDSANESIEHALRKWELYIDGNTARDAFERAEMSKAIKVLQALA